MHVQLCVDDARTVSAIWMRPPGAQVAYAFAHGAGAGMNHPFMAQVADQLQARGVATLRYNFPYMEVGSKRPDTPAVAHAAVQAASAWIRSEAPELSLFAGGKSFGGRMTSQAQALKPIGGVRGLIFLGFPLHPAKRPSIERAAHLDEVAIPMLFIQGTRDALAGMELLEPVVAKLGDHATLHAITDGDHSFAVPSRTGRKREAVIGEIADAMQRWMTAGA